MLYLRDTANHITNKSDDPTDTKSNNKDSVFLVFLAVILGLKYRYARLQDICLVTYIRALQDMKGVYKASILIHPNAWMEVTKQVFHEYMQ